jgi:hypothetical protein
VCGSARQRADQRITRDHRPQGLVFQVVAAVCAFILALLVCIFACNFSSAYICSAHDSSLAHLPPVASNACTSKWWNYRLSCEADISACMAPPAVVSDGSRCTTDMMLSEPRLLSDSHCSFMKFVSEDVPKYNCINRFELNDQNEPQACGCQKLQLQKTMSKMISMGLSMQEKQKGRCGGSKLAPKKRLTQNMTH